MDRKSAEEWICRAHCSYYKPDRKEEERCRGYSIACRLAEAGKALEFPATELLFEPSFKQSFLRSKVCYICPFLVDGCDFTSPEPPDDCLPCGGLILLSGLLRQGKINEMDISRSDLLDRASDSYLSLTPRCSIKRLEEDYLYHISKDELYEVNDEALQMLIRCDGSHRAEDLNPDPDFLEFCIEEDLLELHQTPRTITLREGRSPVPSLRYLEWLVTFRCNLSCAHCYLGESTAEDFPADLVRPLLEQFAEMQGLRILVSGGEPTLYKHFGLLNEALPEFPVRAVLLSNGIALTEEFVSGLNFHEVQISLDGLEQGHDLIRGEGSFRKTLAAMKAVRACGLDLSVATMIHKGSVDEMPQLVDLIRAIGAREWNIDYPCVKGRWEAHPELAVGVEVAAEKMALAFGGSYHGTSPGWTCGRHLASVLPSGELCRCGLFPQRRYGSVVEGLAAAWTRIEHIPIHVTKCGNCSHADLCGGGCRFRAGGREECDEVMCRLYGAQRDSQ